MTGSLGMCFDRSFPAALAPRWASRLEAGGVDQLWVIEDVFYTAGVSLAAAALARTDELTVGLGILPAVARNAAVTAMEIATLAGLAPGRVVGGIGHGVQDWMAQMGARPRSPLTTLDEVLTAVRRLLRGETVTTHGSHVTLDAVTLAHPPDPVPVVLAGVRGPKSLAMAGRAADGLVLAEGAGPSYVRSAIAQAGAPGSFRVAVFSALCIADESADARATMVPFVADLLRSPTANIAAHPHFDEMLERWQRDGDAAIAAMPAAWWHEIGAIGSTDDALAHITALYEAGADDVSLFPSSDVTTADHQIDDVVRLARALR